MLLSLALSLLSGPAVHAETFDIVPRQVGPKRMEIELSTRGKDINTRAFVAAVLDANHYPDDAQFLGVPALEECRVLGRAPNGDVIVYQRTGGSAGIAPRHYVIALHIDTLTDQKAVVTWDLVPHEVQGGRLVGPYADALNAHPQAVYTPHNAGGWSYDRAAGVITYWMESDPGGELPPWLVNREAVMTFPKALLKEKWHIE